MTKFFTALINISIVIKAVIKDAIPPYKILPGNIEWHTITPVPAIIIPIAY
ncbi:MAG: hypothetical protein ACK4OM_04435 [Alphaproteobacteria bacterium]